VIEVASWVRISGIVVDFRLAIIAKLQHQSTVIAKLQCQSVFIVERHLATTIQVPIEALKSANLKSTTMPVIRTQDATSITLGSVAAS
jgi:hypothetical protein